MKVLIVEDEVAYVEALRIALDAEGIDTVAALDGREAIKAARADQYDAILLDLMLPSVGGLDVLRAVRKTSQVPVIVVSAKDSEADVVSALELGADDYLTKPYSVRELLARIHAVVRRSTSVDDPDVWTVGTMKLDASNYQLKVGGETFDLPRKEFEVMALLVEQSGRIVARDRILEEVWGMNWGDTKSLDQHIRRLRRKLEADEGAPHIATIRRVGYRLEQIPDPKF
ncbi:MAG: response regulator transcription factor [Acidimicrobiia bacterium]|nr:response regulator transcription factor [Acidimicrobiia bacterium]